jgi:hypothetical protein
MLVLFEMFASMTVVVLLLGTFLNKNRFILGLDDAHKPFDLVKGCFLDFILVNLREVIKQELYILDPFLQKYVNLLLVVRAGCS